MAIDRRTLRRSLRTNLDPGPRDHLNRAKLLARQALHLPGLAAGGRLRRPIFVIGAPRSGTSMLYAILRRHKDLANWPGEAHEVWEHDHHPAMRGWSSNSLERSDATGPAAERIRRSFYLVAGGNARLIDKTPRNAPRVGFIDELFPDASFIYLKRDGRDNTNSLINAWRTPRYKTYRLPEPHSIPGAQPREWWKFILYPGWGNDLAGPLERVCARQWVFSNEAAGAAFAELGDDRWMDVRYEDLVEDPVKHTTRLLEFLGLPRDDAVLRAADEARSKPVNVVTPPETGKWRRENPEEIAAVMDILRPTMEAMGYPVAD